MQAELPIDMNLGFEPDLIAKYDVSCSALMENISILERSGLVLNARRILRRLFNTCKNPALIVLIRVLIQLSVIIGLYQNISREELEVYSREILKRRLPQIEALIAGDVHALTSLQFQQIELLRELHQRHRGVRRNSSPAKLGAMRTDYFVPDYFDQQFRLCIAENSGNQNIALFTQLIARLSTNGARQKSRQPSGSDIKIWLSQFQQIANAISAGDEALARRGMIRVQLVLAAQNE